MTKKVEQTKQQLMPAETRMMRMTKKVEQTKQQLMPAETRMMRMTMRTMRTRVERTKQQQKKKMTMTSSSPAMTKKTKRMRCLPRYHVPWPKSCLRWFRSLWPSRRL
jgi:hypothetical protein